MARTRDWCWLGHWEKKHWCSCSIACAVYKGPENGKWRESMEFQLGSLKAGNHWCQRFMKRYAPRFDRWQPSLSDFQKIARRRSSDSITVIGFQWKKLHFTEKLPTLLIFHTYTSNKYSEQRASLCYTNRWLFKNETRTGPPTCKITPWTSNVYEIKGDKGF